VFTVIEIQTKYTVKHKTLMLYKKALRYFSNIPTNAHICSL